MNNLELTFVLGGGSFVAGLLGSLTGLGGGVVIIPLITLGFGFDIRYAIGASLISVIGTSSGAAAAYVKEGFTNIRIGMFLEVATTIGAILGAALATVLSTSVIAVLFGLMLLFSAIFSTKGQHDLAGAEVSHPLARKLRMEGTFPVAGGWQQYKVGSVPAGFSLMALAGAISGLLGIGSGALKVLAMDQAMRIPFKVSTTTSNFMIGVTAAASAGIYLNRGYIDPALAMPVMLGVLAGSLLGARVLVAAKTKALRLLFAIVIFALGIEMIVNGVTGRL